MMSKVLIFSLVQCVEGGRISVIGRDVFKCVSILNPNLRPLGSNLYVVTKN